MQIDPSSVALSPSAEDKNPSSEDPFPSARSSGNGNSSCDKTGFFKRLQYLFTGGSEKPDSTLRNVIEEYIVEPENGETDATSTHERVLLSNILKLRDIKVFDAMIPRADIMGLEVSTPQDELLKILSEQQYSRFPVYMDTLDDVLGTVHIKDIIAALAQGEAINLRDMITEIPIVSPSMPILDLVLKMQSSSRHMALVVDEYGGIDGLVTMGDVIEAIIGEVEDEHDKPEDPQITETPDGAVLADGRVFLDEFEDQYGQILDEDEREESDTLGGLVLDLAGRVPVRGEIITHSSGMIFEIVDADPRRINRLKITNIPSTSIENMDHKESI